MCTDTFWYLILFSQNVWSLYYPFLEWRALHYSRAIRIFLKGQNQVKILIFTYRNNNTSFFWEIFFFISMFSDYTWDSITTLPWLPFTQKEKLHNTKVPHYSAEFWIMCTKMCQSLSVQTHRCTGVYLHASPWYFLYATS